MTSDVVGGMAGVRGASGQAGLGNGNGVGEAAFQAARGETGVLFVELLRGMQSVGVSNSNSNAGGAWQWQPESLSLCLLGPGGAMRAWQDEVAGRAGR